MLKRETRWCHRYPNTSLCRNWCRVAVEGWNLSCTRVPLGLCLRVKSGWRTRLENLPRFLFYFLMIHSCHYRNHYVWRVGKDGELLCSRLSRRRSLFLLHCVIRKLCLSEYQKTQDPQNHVSRPMTGFRSFKGPAEDLAHDEDERHGERWTRALMRDDHHWLALSSPTFAS